jgi:hypothetical protein
MKKTVSLKEFKAQILKYKNDERTNPIDPETEVCTYDLDGEHCIVGQALIDLGVNLEEELDYQFGQRGTRNPMASNLSVWDSSEAADFADRVQCYADDSDAKPTPWKNVVEYYEPELTK